MSAAARLLLALPSLMLGCDGDPTFACVSLCNADPCDQETRTRPTLACGCAVVACSLSNACLQFGFNLRMSAPAMLALAIQNHELTR